MDGYSYHKSFLPENALELDSSLNLNITFDVKMTQCYFGGFASLNKNRYDSTESGIFE